VSCSGLLTSHTTEERASAKTATPEKAADASILAESDAPEHSAAGLIAICDEVDTPASSQRRNGRAIEGMTRPSAPDQVIVEIVTYRGASATRIKSGHNAEGIGGKSVSTRSGMMPKSDSETETPVTTAGSLVAADRPAVPTPFVPAPGEPSSARYRPEAPARTPADAPAGVARSGRGHREPAHRCR
jgi:hypothetical protein